MIPELKDNIRRGIAEITRIYAKALWTTFLKD